MAKITVTVTTISNFRATREVFEFGCIENAEMFYTSYKAFFDPLATIRLTRDYIR